MVALLARASHQCYAAELSKIRWLVTNGRSPAGNRQHRARVSRSRWLHAVCIMVTNGVIAGWLPLAHMTIRSALSLLGHTSRHTDTTYARLLIPHGYGVGHRRHTFGHAMAWLADMKNTLQVKAKYERPTYIEWLGEA